MQKRVASSHSPMSQLHGSLIHRIVAFPAFAVLGFCHFRNHCEIHTISRRRATKAPFNPFRSTRSERGNDKSLAQRWSADDPWRPILGGVFSRFSRRGFVDANSQGAFRLDQNRETRGHHYTPSPPGVPRVQEGTKF